MEEIVEINAASESPLENLSPMNFPSDVLKWMKINAKPKMALKLMKCCKYFRHSDGFPYLVVKNFLGIQGLEGGFEWILDMLDGKPIETENLEIISKKLWIIETIVLTCDPRAVSTLLSKTVVCNIQILRLSDQKITLDEFKRLTDGGMVEKCVMNQTTITFENGEMVSLEDICGCLLNIQEIDFNSKVPLSFSLEEAEAKISSKLEKIGLCFPLKNFDFQALFAYMKNHQKILYSFWFWGISKEEFAENIAPSVNKMVQEWSPKYKEPEVFRYP